MGAQPHGRARRTPAPAIFASGCHTDSGWRWRASPRKKKKAWLSEDERGLRAKTRSLPCKAENFFIPCGNLRLDWTSQGRASQTTLTGGGQKKRMATPRNESGRPPPPHPSGYMYGALSRHPYSTPHTGMYVPPPHVPRAEGVDWEGPVRAAQRLRLVLVACPAASLLAVRGRKQASVAPRRTAPPRLHTWHGSKG